MTATDTQTKAVEARATATEEAALANKEAQEEALPDTLDAIEEGVTDLQKAEGAEAMRIAKINHPNVDWQADPITGAPLVAGSAELHSEQEYNPPPPEYNAGVSPEPAPEPVATKKSEDKSSKEASK